MMNFEYYQLLSAGPIIGFLISKKAAPKIKMGLLSFLVLLLIPRLWGYQLNYSILNYIAYTLVIAFLWDLIFRKKNRANFQTSTIVTSVVLFLFLFVSGCLTNLLGSTTQEAAWEKDKYEIRYYESRGFAGTGHLKIYDLHHNILFGLYTRKLDSKTISSFDTTNTHQLNYTKHHVVFDKRTNEISTNHD
ncbi:MAG: hypothetical protein GQ574_18975 [Crocinitomix sp.]|nr:hypothetical protein [Crocinitomix sp.]